MAHIESLFYSHALLRNIKVQVFLPTIGPDEYLFGSEKEYLAKDKKYQTLYLLHGSYDDANCWSRKTNIERYAQEKCLAVVMAPAENSRYQDMAYGEAYETFFTKELPEYLEIIFPLSSRREDRFVTGNSMGGGGAFRFALKHPELYQAAASLSGSLDRRASAPSTHSSKMPESYLRAVCGEGGEEEIIDLLEPARGKELPQLYMICGEDDFVLPGNETFYQKAIECGAAARYEKYPGAHTWEFWDFGIQRVLEWLPLKKRMVYR